MAFEVKVPSVGESVQEGEISKWHKSTGEFVDVDEVLVEIETDKATVDIVAEVAGVVETVVAEGATVSVGEVLARIDTTKAAGTVSPQPAAPSSEQPPPEAAPIAVGQSPASPAVARIAAENNIDLSQIQATGRGGRHVKEDVINFMEKVGGNKSPEPKGKVEQMPTLVQKPTDRAERRVKMSRLRQKIAQNLVKATQTTAMLTTFNEIDMSQVMLLRREYKEAFKEKNGVGLGFMSFFVKAAVAALQEYPAINGYVDEPDIIYHDYYDIGIAVSTEKGLIVPVVRDCDKLSFAGIEQTIVTYAQQGRAGKISIDDLSGGTFTITNGGTFGSLLSTPILNSPQSAILGMHKIEERPMVVKGEIVARPMMYVALSYDHRIVDGKEAVGFLVKIKECIENPSRLLLGV